MEEKLTHFYRVAIKGKARTVRIGETLHTMFINLPLRDRQQVAKKAREITQPDFNANIRQLLSDAVGKKRS